jgi:type IV secretory pathway protease TraF
MLKRIRNCGVLALVLAAGMAVLQPASAQAADRFDRPSDRDRGRVVQNWDRGREVRDRGFVRYNYVPGRRYDDRYYRSHIAYPYGGSVCLR